MPAEVVTLTCTQRVRLTPTVTETTFSLPHQVPFEAGQFLTAHIPNPDPETNEKRPFLKRSYSIATHPELDGGKSLGLCVKLVEGGPGSTFIQGLQPGDTMEAKMPYGKFVWKTPPERTVVFVATGTGISPFRSMMLSRPFREGAKKVIALCGVRHEEELLYEDLMGQDHPFEVAYYPCVSRPKGQWSGFTGRVTDYFYQHAGDWDLPNMDFYMCGAGEMIREVKKWLLEDKGVPKEQLHQEVYF